MEKMLLLLGPLEHTGYKGTFAALGKRSGFSGTQALRAYVHSPPPQLLRPKIALSLTTQSCSKIVKMKCTKGSIRIIHICTL